MPKALQAAVLDRPSLSRLPAGEAVSLSRLIEVLGPPPDDGAMAWVLKNLARCLRELLPQSSGDSRSWLTAEADRAEHAAALLCANPIPPIVTLDSDKTSLYLCFAALRQGELPQKLLQLLGGLYVLRATGSKPVPDAVMELVLRACHETRVGDRASINASAAAALIDGRRQLNQALSQLHTNAISRRSAATSMIEAKVERAFRSGYRFDTDLKLQGAVAPRGLTAGDVIEAGPRLKEGALNGSAGALLTSLAIWHGVLPADMLALPLFAPGPGLMRTDPACNVTVLQLGGILTELARTGLPGVIPTSDELPLPWPRWLSDLIRPLKQANPTALSISDLLGMPSNASELRQLLEGLKLPRRITASKLVIDRAQPLLQSDTDPVLCALASLDFSRVFKVSCAYEHLRPHELLETIKRRAELLGWGELTPAPVPRNGYLSAVTPELAHVQSVCAQLLDDVLASFPGPNANPELVFVHHNAFIRYTAFMLAAGLALRGQDKSLLPASLFLVHALAGEFDKALPNASLSPADLVIGSALQLQLRYLRAHYRALIRRLTNGLSRYSPDFKKFAIDLTRVVNGDPGCSLLVTIQAEGLQSFSPLDLQAYLGQDWPGKADSLRHCLPLILRKRGTTYWSREAALRHVGGSQPIVGPTSVWSQGDWHREASQQQDEFFDELGIRPVGGLIRSLGRCA